MKFRKKPVVIDAFQHKFDDTSTVPVPKWVFDASADGTFVWRDGELHIKTLEGLMHVSEDDWIIRGVKGELYPCKPDIFETTYDPA